MHPIQQAILDLASTQNIRKMSLREIGQAATGKEQSAQKIKYHLECLLAEGYLRLDARRDVIERVARGEKRAGFVSLPIVGAASCGPATQIAQQDIRGYLCLSEKYLPKKRDGLFVVRAVGLSMNRARVNGSKKITDGDFVVIDSSVRTPENGTYVLAITGGMANIKKFVRDESSGDVVLLSESTEDQPPIFVHPEDQTDFFINGKVVDVLKQPTSS